ncbi:MAG: hypothetical protein ABJO09_07370 [Hyphomicrobiales bacterium]
MSDPWLNEDDVDEDDYGFAERQQTAIETIEAAWRDALEQGIEPDILINTSLFAAMSQIVEHRGEDAAVKFCNGLPERIENGEFTLYRVLN